MAMNNIDNDLTSLLGVGEEKLDGNTPFGYQNFAEDILGFESWLGNDRHMNFMFNY